MGVNQWATSYLSFNDPRVHFGLGSHRTIDRLEVHWLDGHVDVHRHVQADRYLTIEYGQRLAD